MTQLYFGSLLEKAGVHVEVLKHGSHKSAMEPYTLSEMSKEHQSDLYQFISDREKWQMTQLKTHKPQINWDLHWEKPDLRPRIVLERGFIQEINENKVIGKKIISPLSVKQSSHWKYSKEVAILHLNGTMVLGNASNSWWSTSQSFGDLDLQRALNQIAANQPPYLILVVNSPGGYAQAATKMRAIWQNFRLKNPNIKVYTHVSGLGASAAYYLISGNENLSANPHSLIGSIGIFAAKPNFSEFLKKIFLNLKPSKLNPKQTLCLPLEPLATKKKLFFKSI
jgi:protease IV